MTEERKTPTVEDWGKIKRLAQEVESIVKYMSVGDKFFTNVGSASSAIRARCRQILRLKGTGEEVIKAMTNTTQLMDAADVKSHWLGSK